MDLPENTLTTNSIDHDFLSLESDDSNFLELSAPQVVHSRRVSRTTKGGRRARYGVNTLSVGSNQWTRYAYFGEGRSEHKLYAVKKSQNPIRMRLDYRNYVVVRERSVSSNFYGYFSLDARYKRTLGSLYTYRPNSMYTNASSNAIFLDTLSFLIPEQNISFKTRGSRNRLSQIGVLKKVLHGFSNRFHKVKRGA